MPPPRPTSSTADYGPRRPRGGGVERAAGAHGPGHQHRPAGRSRSGSIWRPRPARGCKPCRPTRTSRPSSPPAPIRCWPPTGCWPRSPSSRSTAATRRPASDRRARPVAGAWASTLPANAAKALPALRGAAGRAGRPDCRGRPPAAAHAGTTPITATALVEPVSVPDFLNAVDPSSESGTHQLDRRPPAPPPGRRPGAEPRRVPGRLPSSSAADIDSFATMVARNRQHDRGWRWSRPGASSCSPPARPASAGASDALPRPASRPR